jgi:DNA-binding LytR/AlgR family response regulator
MINCFIIADLPTVEFLEKHIDKFPITALCGYSFPDAFNIDQILTNPPTVLFVDIILLKKLKPALSKIGRRCSIILVANTTEYAYEAFEVLALDYLLKPITYEAFERSINKFISLSLLVPPKAASIVQINHKTESITESFFIKSDFRGQKEILIKCNEVIFIESEQNYVVLHTLEKKYICHNTLKEMEENLPTRYFIRVHKSFIINYDKITSVEGNVITLNENEKLKIQIGSTYKKAFFDRKSQKIIKKKNFLELTNYSKYATFLLFTTEVFEASHNFIWSCI